MSQGDGEGAFMAAGGEGNLSWIHACSSFARLAAAAAAQFLHCITAQTCLPVVGFLMHHWRTPWDIAFGTPPSSHHLCPAPRPPSCPPLCLQALLAGGGVPQLVHCLTHPSPEVVDNAAQVLEVMAPQPAAAAAIR